MIIAVATEDNLVAQHFGRCPEYTLFTLEGKAVSNKKVIPNPGHEPGFLPRYLAQMGVSCIIAGGMGPKAQALFTGENIETVIGISGPVEEAISCYLTDSLQPGESSCDHLQGDHHHDCS
ncbi:MAG: NifB/NifX family molybdenum-iron cluster-binding protein [Bacillota bacterium]|nr:NifB/NifX family molybdenum-iron cluster-binding protein [Bacillota bacterium]